MSATSQAPLMSSDMIHDLNMKNVNDAKEQSRDPVLVPTPPFACQPEKPADHCNKDQQVSWDRRETANGAICRDEGNKVIFSLVYLHAYESAKLTAIMAWA